MGFSRIFHPFPRPLRRPLASLFFVMSALLTTACDQNSDSDSGPNVIPQSAEDPYYGTPTSYSGTVTTVTGTLSFNRYNDGGSGLTTVTSSLPIRYAEVHILDGSGNRIQQGETDANGAVSLIIPRTAGNYTLRVNSRADNSYLKASVLDNPYDQKYYSLDTTFTMAGTEATFNVVTSAAPHTNSSNLLGAAFNILDQIYLANQFLRDEAHKCAGGMGCAGAFTVAPKIPIYWSKGVSPGKYYGSPTARISFFTNSNIGNIYRGLYILGGVNGNLCSDTDHFDRSVILHEYGHYLEAAFSRSASPGGSHNGNAIIDPRLAWSEGWADFFQAAALGRNFYRDTTGNTECGNASLSFGDFSMENKTIDNPATNEGIFREISIARTLYDIMTGANQNSSYNMTTDGDSQTGDFGFGFIWHAFKALGNATYKFQNMGILNSLTNTYANSYYSSTHQTDYASILTNERQATSQTLYGQKLSPVGGTCTFSITAGVPVADTKDTQTGEVIESDQLRNNDFFRYDFDGNPANATVVLRYSSGTTPYDLDLYAYKEDYVFLDASTLHAYSVHDYPEPSGAGYESMGLGGAGTYMINVKVDYKGLRGSTTYYLETGSGVRLCP